ncbi:hypothetical protein ACMGGR_17155 [Erwinia sp. BNK-24-b]|uniref:hypothetical protein n=1 Tax=unclassified Erwinia TaxID=2622719 RepID=UPI0039BF5252
MKRQGLKGLLTVVWLVVASMAVLTAVCVLVSKPGIESMSITDSEISGKNLSFSLFNVFLNK